METKMEIDEYEPSKISKPALIVGVPEAGPRRNHRQLLSQGTDETARRQATSILTYYLELL